MFESIKKRDRRVVKFDSSKISAAIAKAGSATDEFGEKEAKKLTLRVLTLAHELQLDPAPEVEEIQDIVEAVLLDSPFFKTAKAYILYREQHSQIRQITTKANVDLVNHYIQKLDWKIKENSNMCYSLQGLNNYISSEVTSEYWLNSIYPPEIRQAHKDGDFHIHDLNLLSVYCVGWDLFDLCRHIKDMGFPVKLDTNGSRPRVIKRLIDEGLVDYIAMDLKTDPTKYATYIKRNCDITSILSILSARSAHKRSGPKPSRLPACSRQLPPSPNPLPVWTKCDVPYRCGPPLFLRLSSVTR